jgi:hypothetical protein
MRLRVAPLMPYSPFLLISQDTITFGVIPWGLELRLNGLFRDPSVTGCTKNSSESTPGKIRIITLKYTIPIDAK